jgi:hypothetical protein
MSADDVCCNITEPDTPHITLSGSSQRFNMPCLAILVFNGPLWVDGWAKDEDATMQGSFFEGVPADRGIYSIASVVGHCWVWATAMC